MAYLTRDWNRPRDTAAATVLDVDRTAGPVAALAPAVAVPLAAPLLTPVAAALELLVVLLLELEGDSAALE